MSRGHVVVHRFGSLGAAASVLDLEAWGAQRELADQAFEGRDPAHHFDGVMSHNLSVTEYGALSANQGHLASDAWYSSSSGCVPFLRNFLAPRRAHKLNAICQ